MQDHLNTPFAHLSAFLFFGVLSCSRDSREYLDGKVQVVGDFAHGQIHQDIIDRTAVHRETDVLSWHRLFVHGPLLVWGRFQGIQHGCAAADAVATGIEQLGTAKFTNLGVTAHKGLSFQFDLQVRRNLMSDLGAQSQGSQGLERQELHYCEPHGWQLPLTDPTAEGPTSVRGPQAL